VNSLYSRLLARNPAIQDHNRNVAEDGTDVYALRGQIDTLLVSDPKPDLVVVTSVDNDIRCDGSDPQNYDAFGAELTDALRALADGAPQARIFLVSQWATVQAYTDAVKDDPVWREDQAGDGPCDIFDVTRVPQPARIAYLQDIVDHYHAQLAASCAQIPTCRYDQGAMQRMTVVPADLTSDGSHLSVQGHRKHAELTWAALQEAGLVEPG
jgi:lysophospholipase L1-like esterase